MRWIAAQCPNLCHSSPGAKPGEPPAFARVPGALSLSPSLRQSGVLEFLIVVLAILTFSLPLAAEAPQTLLASGHVDRALQILNQQIETAPTPEVFNLLCRAYFELGAWDAAIFPCERAVALAPSNGLYHLWLGRAYGEKADHSSFLSAAGMAKKVRTEFERAVQLDPNNGEAHTDLAEFYLEAPGIVGGGKDKARAQAELLERLDPATAHWVKGRIAEREKDNSGAEREYRAALDASQGGVRAWLNLAGFYRHMNRFDEMEQALRTMESRPLDHPAALVDGAGMLLRTGRDYPLAIRLVRRYLTSTTVEEAPVFKAHVVLGELFEKRGDRPAAAEEYRAALAMAHSYRPAQDGLKRVTR
jgi:tetratricopeptide (TPR) repeat protein